jgi:ribosomal protein L35AE/L33A
LNKGTLNTLKITKEQGKKGIEAMKKAHNLPADPMGTLVVMVLSGLIQES